MKQTVLISGSSTGLGRATCHIFASQGWNVIASMRSPEAETELGELPDVLVTRDAMIGVIPANAPNLGDVR